MSDEDNGLDLKEEDQAMPQEKTNGFIQKVFVLFLGSTCWVVYHHIPILPLGAILYAICVKPRKVNRYILIVLASMIGFLGTGLHFSIMKKINIDQKTGSKSAHNTFHFGVRWGLGTLNYFRFKGKVILYDDTKFPKEVAFANAYVKKFVEHINTGDPSFFENTFVYQEGVTKEQVHEIFNLIKSQGGNVSSSDYMGYLYWIYPDQKYKDITVVHKTKFEKDADWGSIAYRLIFFPEGLKLTRVDLCDSSREYVVMK